MLVSSLIVSEASGRGFSQNHYSDCCGRMYPVQYESYQWEKLTGNIKFASKVHLGVRANIRVAKGTAISSLAGGQSG